MEKVSSSVKVIVFYCRTSWLTNSRFIRLQHTPTRWNMGGSPHLRGGYCVTHTFLPCLQSSFPMSPLLSLPGGRIQNNNRCFRHVEGEFSYSSFNSILLLPDLSYIIADAFSRICNLSRRCQKKSGCIKMGQGWREVKQDRVSLVSPLSFFWCPVSQLKYLTYLPSVPSLSPEGYNSISNMGMWWGCMADSDCNNIVWDSRGGEFSYNRTYSGWSLPS